MNCDKRRKNRQLHWRPRNDALYESTSTKPQPVTMEKDPVSTIVRGASSTDSVYHDAQPDESVAKLCVRKPGGAIRRNDRTGRSVDSLRPISSSGLSAVANANGLESHPPGSAGKLSRPAMVKLL